jgi:hypothetical protein
LRNVRTLYECVVVAHHLHLHPEKKNDYFAMFYVQWAKILQNLPSPTMTDMHRTVSQYVPKFAQGKMVGLKDLDWSGKHTREMAEEAGEIAKLHPLAFDHAFAYVHPSILFFLSTLTHDAGTELFQVGVKSQDQDGSLVLRASHDMLLNAVELRLKYVASDCRESTARAMQAGFHQYLGLSRAYLTTCNSLGGGQRALNRDSDNRLA